VSLKFGSNPYFAGLNSSFFCIQYKNIPFASTSKNLKPIKIKVQKMNEMIKGIKLGLN
jgi:hypothetical protein